MRGTPIRLFLAALVPPAIVFPLRFLAFGDANPFTLILLGPALEEGLKLAGLFLALLLAALTLPRGDDSHLALRYWLFLTPWFVGGLYGMTEGFFAYAGESSLEFTMREVAHGSFTALALAAALWIWRELDVPYVGVALGFGAGWAAHIVFNMIAFLSNYVNITFTDQAAYATALVAIAAVALGRSVGREPASREARRFLAIRRTG